MSAEFTASFITVICSPATRRVALLYAETLKNQMRPVKHLPDVTWTEDAKIWESDTQKSVGAPLRERCAFSIGR